MAGGMDEGTRGLVVADRFQLVQRLGHGGMGTVWRARDLMLERDVALKEVRTTAGTGSEETAGRRDRVLQEARALARINHPHVVTVHHIVEALPYPWIVMELLPGRTLGTLLQSGPVTVRKAADYGAQILAALRAAHGAGILHRDVKPANVLLRDDGTAVLTDFGIARATNDGAMVPERIVGSPEYLAPERVLGSPGDPASDLWSLGVLLYALVEGRPPYRCDEPHLTLAAVVDEPVPPPRQAGALAPLLKQLLVKEPADRPDAARVAELLAAVTEGGDTATAPTPQPPPYTPPPPPPPPVSPYAPSGALFVPDGPPPGSTPPSASKRRRGVLVAAVAAVVAGAALAAGLLLLPDRSDDGRDTAGDGESTEPTESADPESSTDPADDEAGEESEAPEDPTESADPAEPDPGPSPDDSPAPPGAVPPGDLPEEETGPADTWIAQLHSEPVSSGTGERDDILAALRAEVPETEVLRSDDHASLVPGYWVYYVPGPFDDGREAVTFCAEHGRSSANECVGRFVSDSAEHREFVCHPDGGGSGRCED